MLNLNIRLSLITHAINVYPTIANIVHIMETQDAAKEEIQTPFAILANVSLPMEALLPT